MGLPVSPHPVGVTALQTRALGAAPESPFQPTGSWSFKPRVRGILFMLVTPGPPLTTCPGWDRSPPQAAQRSSPGS